MADDSSLDDFFAKKDKSKKKTKAAKYTSDDFLKKQKKGKKKAVSNEEQSQSQNLEVDLSKANIDNEEEWLEVTEEEKDYSGLRISNLQLQQEKENEDRERDGNASGNDDVDSENRQDSCSGPWAKVETPQLPEPVVVQPEPEPKQEETPPSRPGKYIPPGARQAATQQTNLIGPGMGSGSGYRRSKKEAPNLQSEEDFPTLGGDAVGASESVWGSGSKFERVKSGGKQLDSTSNKGPQLSLDNKYTALQGGGTE